MIKRQASITTSACIALVLAGCSSSTPSTPPGSGGRSAGGSTSGGGGSGGSTTSGGSTAAGGSPASGSGGAVIGGSSSGGSQSGGTAGSADKAGSGGQAGGSAGLGGGSIGGSTATGGSGTAGGPSGVTVKLAATHQTIQGFGLNTALSSATPAWDTFYSTAGAGLGLSIVRVAMTASGGISGSVPPKSYNAKVIASPWTAPANCKDNNNTQKGGHLLTTCYDSWSTKIADFAKANGVYAMGAANEPDFASCGSTIGPPCNGDYDTMIFTAKEMVDFMKVLAPKLKTAGVKVMAPEASEWIHLWSNTSATGSTTVGHPNSSDPLKCGCFGNTPTTTGCASTCTQGNGYDYGHWLAKDATVWPAIDIIGTHEYDSQKAEPWPADVDGGKRSKEVWETEVSGVMYWPEQGPSSDIKNGIAVAQWIHSALVVGEASAWLYWWYQANGDNEGLVFTNSASTLTKRCYTLGNYSKFVRPGYVMVEVTGNSNADLLISAFTGTDGTVIVAINQGSKDASVPIAISGGTAPASCTPYVTASSASDNLKAGTAVPVSGGSFTAPLVATSVTTFVCK